MFPLGADKYCMYKLCKIYLIKGKRLKIGFAIFDNDK